MKTLKTSIVVMMCVGALSLGSCVSMGHNNVVDHSVANPDNGPKGAGHVGIYKTNSFANWDRDDDGMLIRREFNDGIVNEGLFFAWDNDKSGYLTASEYAKGVYARMDANGSGKISSDEWATRNTVWASQQDRNVPLLNDGMTCKQFEGSFANSNFNAWDADKNALLDINELNEGVFKTLDQNSDGSISNSEFDGYYRSGNAPEIKMLGSIRLW